MIRVGTCGFQYRDWVTGFYPRSLDRGSWLAHYSQKFGCCELGFTSYRMPESGSMAQLVEGSGGRVQFVFRVPAGLLGPQPLAEVASRFAEVLWPVREAGQLAGVLARFTGSFKFNRENFARLRAIRDLLAGMRLIAEFASQDWLTRPSLRHLVSEDIALACIEGGGPFRLTACPGYVRFDGRSRSRWLAGDGSTRHDYLYTKSELQSLVPEIRGLEQQGGTVLVFMNNPWRGQAPLNALMIMELLQDDGHGRA